MGSRSRRVLSWVAAGCCHRPLRFWVLLTCLQVSPGPVVLRCVCRSLLLRGCFIACVLVSGFCGVCFTGFLAVESWEAGPRFIMGVGPSLLPCERIHAPPCEVSLRGFGSSHRHLWFPSLFPMNTQGAEKKNERARVHAYMCGMYMCLLSCPLAVPVHMPTLYRSSCSAAETSGVITAWAAQEWRLLMVVRKGGHPLYRADWSDSCLSPLLTSLFSPG